MKIQRVQNNYITSKHTTPAFHSWSRDVYKDSGSGINMLIKEIRHRNNTSLCREPNTIIGPVKHYWENYIHYIIEKYKDVPKVNVYCLGCSNGAESVTQAIGLRSVLNNTEFSKYMPIKASDYDPVAIEYARSGLISVGWREAERIDELTNGQFGRFFYKNNPNEHFAKSEYFKYDDEKIRKIIASLIPEEEQAFHIASEITDNIEYKVADALKEVDNIEPDNSIVNASNFWLYLGTAKAQELAQKLYDNLGHNSCVRIGGFDAAIRADKLLCDAGFTASPISYVYEKLPTY